MNEKLLNILSYADDKYVEEAFVFQPAAKRRVNYKRAAAVAAGVCVIATAATVGFVLDRGEQVPAPSQGLSWGYDYSGVGDGAPMPDDYCAYRSDTNTFDIDNVTLTFSFGGLFHEDIEWERESRSIPQFDIYFADENGVMLHLIRHNEENYVSEEYRAEWVVDENWNILAIEYAHSEEITIPAELFTQESGMLYFCVAGVDIRSYEQDYRDISSARLYYSMADGKVVLSPWGGYVF